MFDCGIYSVKKVDEKVSLLEEWWMTGTISCHFDCHGLPTALTKEIFKKLHSLYFLNKNCTHSRMVA